MSDISTPSAPTAAAEPIDRMASVADFERPYWEAANRHELVIQRAVRHKVFVFPPLIGAPPWCAGDDLEWVSFGSDVEGTVYSYTVVQRPMGKLAASKDPYVAALCDIAGAPGARLMANIIGVPIDEVHIGMKVRMFWQDFEDRPSLPQWGPF